MARCTLSDRLKCENKLFFIFLYAPIRSCDKGSFCGRICGLWCYMARNPCKYRASSTCIFASKTACRGFESFCPCQRKRRKTLIYKGFRCFFVFCSLTEIYSQNCLFSPDFCCFVVKSWSKSGSKKWSKNGRKERKNKPQTCLFVLTKIFRLI